MNGLSLPSADVLKQIIEAVAVFAAAITVGILVRSFGFKWVGKLSARTKTRIDDILIRSLKGPLLLWFAILGLNLTSRTVQFPPLVQTWIDRVTLVAWIVSFTWVLARIVGEVIGQYGSRIEGALPVTSLTRNITKIVVYLIGLLFIFQALNISITPVITALGVGGLAVALALQDTLSNLFAGMYTMMARQVRVGDYIKLESGEEGYVTDISWRATTIRMLPNNIIIVPNSKLAQTIITNYYLPEKRMSLLIRIGVSYSSDPEQVEKILIEETLKGVDEIPGLLREPLPFVRFIPGFGDSSLDFTLICQVREFVDQYLAQHELRKRIFKRFKAEGIEIPYPQRTLHVADSIRIDTKINSDA